jgi:hypothetical protein
MLTPPVTRSVLGQPGLSAGTVNEGTYIIPIFVPSIDSHGTHDQGIHGSKTGQSLGNYDFKNMWIR